MAARAGGKTSNVVDITATGAKNLGANAAGFTAGIAEATVNETIGRDYDYEATFIGNDNRSFTRVPQPV